MIDLKLEPEHGVVMRNYRGVFPGYHMNKTHWNTIRSMTQSCLIKS